MPWGCVEESRLVPGADLAVRAIRSYDELTARFFYAAHCGLTCVFSASSRYA